MKRTIRDIDIRDKRVLTRVDFNVPLDANRCITDDNRIRQSIPTIQMALEMGAKRVVLMSHLGRPKGKPNPAMSLAPAARRLSELIGQDVVQCTDCTGQSVQREIEQASAKIFLLENLRFYAGEEKNDPAFAKGLASFGDVYINDAFGTSHRAHASVHAITRFLPASAGLLLEKEIKYLGETVKKPKKPFIALLGGAKVSDKIGVIDNLIHKVDGIIIGGAMAYTFLSVKGVGVGSSRVEADKLGVAEEILKKAATNDVEILLPQDHIIVQAIDEKAPFETCEEDIKEGWMGVDIGPKSIKRFVEVINAAKTVVWNGPMGIFEMKNFANGSAGVAKALADNHQATTIIGGGDTAACVIQFGLADRMSHISTGGGASLEYLEGKDLPGISVLGEVQK